MGFLAARETPDWLWLLYLPAPDRATSGSGQAWRLVTSALLHGGWLHILFNAMWIWSLGRAIETTPRIAPGAS